MPALVSSNFDEDPIKNERPSLETSFSHYKSMGILDAQWHRTELTDLDEIRTRPRCYACPRYL